MPRSSSKTHSIVITHLTRFMSAMALGVFCGGLLLFDQNTDLVSIVTVQPHRLVRLIFLLWMGISFGTGVTLAKIL